MIVKDWNQKTVSSKILIIIRLIISVAVIILSYMQVFDIWDKAMNIFVPLLGVLMLIQAIENWKTNRSIAYFSLCAAIFILIAAIIILFL